MKTKSKIAMVLAMTSIAALPVLAGPAISIQVNPPVVVAPAPVIVTPPPAPVVTVAVVPDTYAWDGTEYVGVVGDQYYYLGPGNVWMVMDPGRLGRFHDWERGHADWRVHATVNEKYRYDAHHNYAPYHDNHGHDNDHGDHHDNGH
ncbi:MAG TPA: hypothetical protein VGI03_07265 [Verrucomicrobiae bacterium]